MPKKQRNAFYFYMIHYKKYEESRGRRFNGGMREVAEAAGKYWNDLTKEQRAPYELKAKEDKENGKSRHYERYTSSGIPLSEIEAQQREKEAHEEGQRKTIEALINHGVAKRRLHSQKFYILSFNYFIKDASNQYYPCEMGVTKFCLRNGVTEKCHALINPGKLPTGFAYSAITHANETHRLPLHPDALGATDYSEVLLDLTNFVSEEKSLHDSDDFFLLVWGEEEKMVENILAQLCEKSDVDLERYKLLPITYFFYYMRKTLENLFELKQETQFTEITAHIYLDKDIYRYNKGNGCDFHEEKEVNYHCAVSRCTRLAYTILEQTMDLADVTTRLPGFHYPIDCKRLTNKTPKMVVKKEEEPDSSGFETASACSSSAAASSHPVKIKSEFSDLSTICSNRYNVFRNVSATDDSADEDSSQTSRIRQYLNPFALFRANLEEKETIGRKTKPNLFEYRERQVEADRSLDDSYKEKVVRNFYEDED